MYVLFPVSICLNKWDLNLITKGLKIDSRPTLSEVQTKRHTSKELATKTWKYGWLFFTNTKKHNVKEGEKINYIHGSSIPLILLQLQYLLHHMQRVDLHNHYELCWMTNGEQ